MEENFAPSSQQPGEVALDDKETDLQTSIEDYVDKNGFNDVDANGISVIPPEHNIDGAQEANEVSDRPTSMRLESVLEYASKIKVFMGLKDESENPSLNLPPEPKWSELPSRTEQISDNLFVISDKVPDNLEEDSVKKPVTPGAIVEDDITLEVNAEQIPDILEMDNEFLNNSEPIKHSFPDVIEADVGSISKDDIEQFPDVLEDSNNQFMNNSVDLISDILETDTDSSPVSLENTNSVLNTSESLLKPSVENNSSLLINDNASNCEDDIKCSSKTPEANNDTAVKAEFLTEKGCDSDNTVDNIKQQFNLDTLRNNGEHSASEKFPSQETCKEGDEFFPSEAISEKTNPLEYSAVEDSVKIFNSKRMLHPQKNFNFDDELGCNYSVDGDEAENPYQITHIEEGLREAEKSLDLTKADVAQKAENSKDLVEDLEEVILRGSDLSNSQKRKSKRSMEDLRRLSAEVVNSVLQSAEDQVKVILRERNSILESNEPLSTTNKDIDFKSDKTSDEMEKVSSDNKNSPTSEIVPVEISEDTFQDLPICPKSIVAETESESFSQKDGKAKDVEMQNLGGITKYDAYVMKADELDSDYQCGLGPFRPQCLQPYATAKTYLVLYSIIGILHGSYYTYLVGVLSTLEKRFEFKSKTSGFIMMLDELTPLFLGVIVGHFGGRAHRPRLLSFGMFLSAFCCFASALPYFLYGTATHLTSISVHNKTGVEMCNGDVRSDHCDSDDQPPTVTAIFLLMLGSFLKGFGNLAYYAIGLAYLDDNAKKKNTPIYFAVAFALRLIGPMLGFLMSSAFLKYYENPFDDPGFGPEDPRWIGGWWMGFMLQGILLMIFAGPMAFFPRVLPGHKKMQERKISESSKMFDGLLDSLKRLARNPLYILIGLHAILTVYGNFGFFIMMPKYMENQFRLSASNASLFAGPPGIAALMVSTVIGGYLIWKFKPSAKFLTGGLVATEVLTTVGYLLLMIPQCERIEMKNFGYGEESLILEDQCNINCNCSTVSYTPVCGPDQLTYFSPCYAGCSYQSNQSYFDCSCIEGYGEDASVTKGPCSSDTCWSQALGYIIILPIMHFIINILRVAHTMIMLRSITPEDKSIALGVFETVLSTVAFIPFPVLYGALVDSTCLVWEKSCGETGNCWFYDMQKFNYMVHGASAFFCGLSIFCVLAVFFMVNRVRDLYEEEGGEDDHKESGVNPKKEHLVVEIKL